MRSGGHGRGAERRGGTRRSNRGLVLPCRLVFTEDSDRQSGIVVPCRRGPKVQMTVPTEGVIRHHFFRGLCRGNEGDASTVPHHNEARPKKWGRLIAEFYERVVLRLPQGIRFLLAHGEMAIEMICQYRGIDPDPEVKTYRLFTKSPLQAHRIGLGRDDPTSGSGLNIASDPEAGNHGLRSRERVATEAQRHKADRSFSDSAPRCHI
jgi:hypothetical protein